MNNQIQLVLKSSTTELSLNDHDLGIYLTPELEGLTGLPEIRTTSGVNAGYDGGWTSAQNYDARSITIRGVIANENVATVEQLRRQLTTLAGQGKNEELTLDLVTQAGKAYTIQVRTIALEMALQKVLCQQEFMLQLRADDPLIYDGGSSGESVIVQVQKAIGGFQIDFELPLAISGGSGESTINNGGLEQVYPIIKMYGALHNPTFVNQTTNQQFQINATLGFAEGAWHTPSELYEGTTINIQDAPDNAPLASFQLDGETSQNGTPTPDAPVPVKIVTGENELRITGKNIAKLFSGSTSFSQSGATTNYTSSNGRIYITTDYPSSESSGAQIDVTSGHTQRWAYTATSAVNATDQHLTGDGGTYNFYISVSSGVSSGGGAPLVSAVIAIQDNSSSTVRVTEKYINLNNTPAPVSSTLTITLGEHEHVKCIGLYIQNVAATNSEIKVQLEKGSATEFEPYQSQSYEVNLGKNLLNMATLVPGYVNGSNGSITVSQTQGEMCSGFIKVEPSTKYTVSIAKTTSTYPAWFGIGEYTTNNESGFIRRQANTTTPTSYTITTHSTTQYVRVSARNLKDATEAQFEKGQMTNYAPYFTPIELCKIGTYQDSIYKSGSKWYVHKEVGKAVFDGSNDESWKRQTQIGLYIGGFSGVNRKVGLANLAGFVDTTLYGGFWDMPENKCGISGIGNFGVKTSNYDVSAWRTLLGSSPLSLYYPLATPTDTEITNAALIEQLEAVLGGHTYAGTNNITTITPNEQGTLEISYMTEKDADKRDVMVIDSRMRTVTLNGADIYHLITAGSEFPMLAPGENKLLLRSDTPGDNGYADVNYKQGYLTI